MPALPGAWGPPGVNTYPGSSRVWPGGEHSLSERGPATPDVPRPRPTGGLWESYALPGQHVFIAALCAMRMTVSGDQGSLYNRLCTIAIVSCLQNEGFGFDPGEKCKAMWKEHGPPSGIGDARALGRGMTILAVHAARAAHRRDEHTLFLGGLCPPKPSHPLPSPPPLGAGTRLLPPAGGGWEGGRMLRTVFTSAVHAAPPHTDGMNIHCSWEGFALPNPP